MYDPTIDAYPNFLCALFDLVFRGLFDVYEER